MIKKQFFPLIVSLLIVSTSCTSKLDTTRISDPLSEDEITSTTSNGDLELLSIALSPHSSDKQSSSTEAVKEANPRDILSQYTASKPRNLFNGIDLSGWVSETGAPPQGWTVKDGILSLIDPENGGDLLTSESFENYILTFEWRFGLECNSGVKYKIEQPNGKGWIGLEYQVQDDAHVEDGKIEARKIASLFDVLPAKTSTRSASYSAPKTQEPSGEFRQGKIIVADNNVEHWIDGECVLAFTIGNAEWNTAKSNSKFKNQKNFGLISSSPILLQAHGYPVDYRNITIQTLSRNK